MYRDVFLRCPEMSFPGMFSPGTPSGCPGTFSPGTPSPGCPATFSPEEMNESELCRILFLVGSLVE